MRSIYSLILGLFILNSCDTFQQKAPPPNILFAIADDATWQHFSAYGSQWVNTPNFDRVAKGGILFNRAYTPNAKCAPSRACILTGRNPWQLGAAINHWPYFPEEYTTYAEALATQGYYVGFTGKGWAPGVAMKDGKQRQMTGKPFQEKKLDPPTKYISKIDYAGNFESFLDSAQTADEPFVFWYGAREPHRRYEFGSGVAKGGKSLSNIDKVPKFWPDVDTVRHDLLDYAYEIEYFDQHLGKMLDELEKRGMLENTLIVVTADNGMPFPRVKANVFEMNHHLPLAVMWKDGIKKPGREVDDLVNFIDFAPTFLEVAGLKASDIGMKEMTGRSLKEYFFGPLQRQTPPERNRILLGKERHDIGRPGDVGYPVRGIIKGNFLYVHNYEPNRWPAGNPETGYLATDGSATKSYILNHWADGGMEMAYWQLNFGKRDSTGLYNISTEPTCMINLIDRPQYTNLIKEMKAQMEEELLSQGDLRMMGKGGEYEKYPYADSSGVNFYERYMRGEKVNSGWVNPSDFEKGDFTKLIRKYKQPNN